jgi:cytochrome P450
MSHPAFKRAEDAQPIEAAPTEPPGPLLRLTDLPGPRPWPVVGNMLQLRLGQLHEDIEALCHQYGPFFRLRFGRNDVMVVCDHETTNQVLKARPQDFRRSKRMENVTGEIGIKLGLFGAEGPTWHRQRRMVMASFSPQQIRAYFPSLLKVAERLQRRWLKAADQGASMDLQAELMLYTVDTITGLAFGLDMNTLEGHGDTIQNHLDEIFAGLYRRAFAVIPHWRMFKLPADRRLERSVLVVNEAIRGFMAQAHLRLRHEPSRRDIPPNLLEAFIVAAQAEGSGVDDDDVAGNVLTMLLAGEDTTANTLAWMIYLLHRHPEALQQATQEVLAAAPRGLAEFTPEVMTSLDFVDACAQETMRLKPVAPFLPAEALRDTVVAGVAIPKGTLVWNVLRHDSVSEQHFEAPLAFRPERWLKPAQAPKGVALPFGSGARICPGRYLALLEIKMAMAVLLSNFEITTVDTPDGLEAREFMSFTMGPLGLRMRLKRRP